MLNFLKRLLPRDPLPLYLHVHLDEAGKEWVCDESICRPPQSPSYLFPTPR